MRALGAVIHEKVEYSILLTLYIDKKNNRDFQIQGTLI